MISKNGRTSESCLTILPIINDVYFWTPPSVGSETGFSVSTNGQHCMMPSVFNDLLNNMEKWIYGYRCYGLLGAFASVGLFRLVWLKVAGKCCQTEDQVIVQLVWYCKRRLGCQMQSSMYVSQLKVHLFYTNLFQIHMCTVTGFNVIRTSHQNTHDKHFSHFYFCSQNGTS